MTSEGIYDSGFFRKQSVGSRRSAEIVLPLVLERIHVASALDVGCGVGSWLSVLRDAGIEETIGVDGPWVERSELMIPASCFHSHDLATPLDLGRRFDLVMSLEVAEHLPLDAADTFVESLVRHGDLLLFSAAVPTQGGSNHVNCQWQSWWLERFTRHGFQLFDFVRPLVWTDRRVKDYYRQNSMVLARGDAAERLARRPLPATPVDIVNPDFVLYLDWERRTEVPGVKRSARQLVVAIRRSTRRRLGAAWTRVARGSTGADA